MEENGKIVLSEVEQNGLKRMRLLNKEFLAKNEGSAQVRNFLTKAGSDNVLLLTYLKGRKFRPEHAWETLKRKAEVRFDQYPEVFVQEAPKSLHYFQKHGIFGVLKNRDKHGRIIMCCNGQKFNPDEYSFKDVTIVTAYIMEHLLKDEGALNNGIIYIQNCEGMGVKHAKQYTLPAMLRLINVFWYACPLRFKGVYYINLPVYLTFVYGIIKPFLSKKLKDRISFTKKNCDAIYANVDPDMLPRFLGGAIEDCEAFEEII